MKLLRLAIPGLLIPLLVSCHAVRQQKALDPVPDSALFHNLQVFPQNVTRPQLMDAMRGFTSALHVHCDHCHVPLSQELEDFDFVSDAKPAKEIAREMIRMTRSINGETVLRINPDARPVTCATCHRGKPIPDPS